MYHTGEVLGCQVKSCIRHWSTLIYADFGPQRARRRERTERYSKWFNHGYPRTRAQVSQINADLFLPQRAQRVTTDPFGCAQDKFHGLTRIFLLTGIEFLGILCYWLPSEIEWIGPWSHGVKVNAPGSGQHYWVVIRHLLRNTYEIRNYLAGIAVLIG